MGSESRGGYGSSCGSQPYAPTYHVVGSMMARDKADPDIYSSTKGYFHNPTAVNIEDAVKGNRIVIDGKRPGGPVTYVMDTKGNIVIGVRKNPNDSAKRSPHPTLLGGKDPQVQCAGMITFKDGRIYSVNTNSGHYRPNTKSLQKVESALDKLYEKNPNLFSRDSKWRKK